ncbi:MAG TPA: LysR substrate-binding domain-containing protein, partial [Polyangiaceae bacterium]
LAAFLDAYPEIDFDIVIEDAFVDIVKEGFDAGIRIGESVEREMSGVRVSPDLEMAVVASPAYFAKHGKPKHPRDLAKHDCINYRRRTTGVVYRWEFDENGKTFDIAVNGRILVNDGDLMNDAARAGLGLAYVIEASVREDLAKKRLVRVLSPFCASFPGFFLYYPSRTHLAPKLQALVDTLRWKRVR